MIDLLKRFRLLFTALVFLFAAFLVFTFHARGNRDTSIFQKTLMEISFPLQQGAQKVFLWVEGLGEHYIFLSRVQEENQKLKKAIVVLQEENLRLREGLLAQERLKNLYGLQSRYAIGSRVAQVYARDPSSWFSTFLINKGRVDGIAKDMAVVASAGLVGRVIEVSRGTAKVLLITDPNSALDVINQRSRSQGILEGKTDKICILKYVHKSDDVQVGDPVITSGLGGIFPKGLIAGTVNRVEKKYPGLFQYVEVTPAVDLSKLEEVLVLGEFP
jgi:rod shape-determining protein MreC